MTFDYLGEVGGQNGQKVDYVILEQSLNQEYHWVQLLNINHHDQDLHFLILVVYHLLVLMNL